MDRLPAPSSRLCDLPLPDLLPPTRELLQRTRACLYVVTRPEIQARAILAGYTPEIHAQGIFCASLVLGERSFGEWRQWRSLRPPRDPDLPELVAELEQFLDRWRPRVMAAVADVPDAGDRGELESYLDGPIERTSRTARAKAWVARIEGLAKVPAAFYADTWAQLVAQGIATELPRFHEVLKTVQGFIVTASLDADELAEIQAAREASASSVEEWLNARRDQFAGYFSDETLILLGLGELVPAPMPPEISIYALAEFRAAARA